MISPLPRTGTGLLLAAVLVASPGVSRAQEPVVVETAGVRLEVLAVPYLGPASTATVLIALEAEASAGTPSAATLIATITTTGEPSNAVSSGAMPSPVRVTGALPTRAVPPATRPMPFVTELALPPGRHTLSVDTRAGSQPGPQAAVDVEVPLPLPPGSPGFLMSPILLASGSAAGAALGDASEDRIRLPILFRPPTPRHAFAADDQVELYAEIYDGESAPGQEQQFAVITTVRDGSGAVVFRVQETGLSEPFATGRYGFAHSTLVPVHRFAPGPHTLEVRVRSLADAAITAARETRFVLAPAP